MPGTHKIKEGGLGVFFAGLIHARSSLARSNLMPPRNLFLMLCLFTLSACTQAKLAAVNLSQFTFDGRVERSIAYGDGPRQTLDVYVPDQKLSNETWPVVMFIHGGRWSMGERTDYAFIGAKMAELGYITVIPSYRLYPDVKWPVMMEDIALAAKWVDQNIGTYGAQGDDIFLMGHSSGAHMAAMLIADDTHLKQYGMYPSFFKGFAGLAGPYHFTPVEPDLVDLFGGGNYERMQVTHYIDGGEPPMLLLHGLRDELVLIGNQERLAARIRAQGAAVETRRYRDMNHEDMLKAFTFAGRDERNIIREIDAFFRGLMGHADILVRPGVAPWRSYGGVSGRGD